MSPWVNLADSDAQDKKSKVQDLVYIKRLWPFVQPQLRTLIFAGLLLPVVTLTQVAQPWLVKTTIDGPVSQGDFNALMVNTAIFVGLVAFHYVARYINLVLTQVVGQKMIHALRVHVYSHVMNLGVAFHTKTPVGKLVTRVTADIENINEVFSSGCIGIVSDALVISAILIAMFFIQPQLAITVYCVLPLLILVVEIIRKRSRKAYNALRVHLAEMNIQLQETLSGMDLVQQLSQQTNRQAAFEEHNQAYNKSNIKTVIYDSSLTAIIEVFSYLTMLAVIISFITTQHTATAISYGTLLAFLYYIQMLFEPIELLSDKFTFIQSGLASVEKLMELLDEPLPKQSPIIITPPSAKTEIVENKKGAIRFENVTFGYNPEKRVLNNISFEIKAGEKTAIIGRTGAGKSTIIKLLGNYYQPQSGTIYLDDTPIQQIPIEMLRKKIGLIPQQDFLFSDTLLKNITFNNQDEIDTQRLAEILKDSHVDNLISQLPEGLETILSERGKSLSAGERQLVVFARALWYNPTVLILDEATSAIDPKTEALIKTALDCALKGRTAIMIAHRLSTIQSTDKVIVLEAGQVKAISSTQAFFRQLV